MFQIVKKQADRFISAMLRDLQKILGDHCRHKGDNDNSIDIEDNGQHFGNKRRNDHISKADSGAGNEAIPQGIAVGFDGRLKEENQKCDHRKGEYVSNNQFIYYGIF